MTIHLCLDEETDALIRSARGWTELHAAVVTALQSLNGACFAQVCQDAGVSVVSGYAVRRGATNRPRNETLASFAQVLAPGHVVAMTGSCAVRTVTPAITHDTTEWRPIPGLPGWEAKHINGKLVPGVEGVRPVERATATA